MKTFLELARERYSVRSFRQQPVEEEKLDAILEAGMVAPTATNAQPQKVYIIRSEQMLKKAYGACRYLFNAPVVLAIGYDRERDWKNRFMPPYHSGETDAAIVCTHMMLAAWEQGIGSCWVGAFNADDVSRALSLPDNVQITALLPLGYAAEDAAPSPRHFASRPREEIVEEL